MPRDRDARFILLPHESGEPAAGASRSVRRPPQPRPVATPDSNLSDREREILTLLALGSSGTEIAARLHLAEETVRTHVRNARAKLGATNRTHAVALALRGGEISI